MSSFFAKISARVKFYYLLSNKKNLFIKFYWLTTCRLCNEGLLIRFLVHGKFHMVRSRKFFEYFLSFTCKYNFILKNLDGKFQMVSFEKN